MNNSVFNVTIDARVSPEWKNNEIFSRFNFNINQLYGIVAIATAIFGEARDELFALYDEDNQKIDLNALLKESGSVLLEGDVAFDIVPEYDEYGTELSWIDMIADVFKKEKIDKYITKPFTVKAAGADGVYIFQFEMGKFYDGMIFLINELGLNPDDVLVYLHITDVPINLPISD